jgi:sec-independent protein translocase protein TatA
MLGLDAPSHWLILLIAAAVLFGGYKKLPEITRSVGRSLRIFKTEMKGLTDDDAARDAAEAPKAQPQVSATPVAPVGPQVDATPVSPVPPLAPPLGADTGAAAPPVEVSQPAAEAPRETPQQQAQS